MILPNELRKELWPGAVKAIASAANVSPTTVTKAFAGKEIKLETANAILTAFAPLHSAREKLLSQTQKLAQTLKPSQNP